ncbi:hypothetical protein I2I05_08650 [Hymenobacter sp. BT683]|uniref:Uncharacterized protein n=1 Tax=Hymenobacter jeongseonensis TaxID=2791027 RepID=A0ABS0IGI3_9BACT|nr:hypothetical protein [Hymenobacter jeongseonensis]MBF9237466.1 hypothetical protein [Hymenobacter jeongseonensis]
MKTLQTGGYSHHPSATTSTIVTITLTPALTERQAVLVQVQQNTQRLKNLTDSITELFVGINR